MLAGGQGRRMGGVDKGWSSSTGGRWPRTCSRALLRRSARFWSTPTRISTGIAPWATPSFPDDVGGFAGPLAGLHAGLSRATRDFAVTVPCDSPFLPADLVARLAAALEREGAQLAVAKTFDQPHPVFALVRRDALPSLAAFLESGGRKIDAWYAALAVVEVRFDDESRRFPQHQHRRRAGGRENERVAVPRATALYLGEVRSARGHQ